MEISYRKSDILERIHKPSVFLIVVCYQDNGQDCIDYYIVDKNGQPAELRGFLENYISSILEGYNRSWELGYLKGESFTSARDRYQHRPKPKSDVYRMTVLKIKKDLSQISKLTGESDIFENGLGACFFRLELFPPSHNVGSTVMYLDDHGESKQGQIVSFLIDSNAYEILNKDDDIVGVPDYNILPKEA